MTIIDLLQGGWATDNTADVSSTQVDSSTGIDRSESVEQAFGSLLSVLQGNGNEVSGSVDVSVDASIESIQQNLLSAIGLEGFSIESLSQLTSVSNMQTSLLSNLQASLFQTATVTANAADEKEASSGFTSLNSGSSQADIATTFISSMEDFSDYSIGEDGFGLDDVFDTLNVLNHIPVIADIYQDATDTVVDPISEVLGGYAYGGTIGMAYAAADLAVEAFSGKSIYDNLSDYFFDESEQVALDSVVTQVSDTVTNTNKAYSFVTKD